MSVIEQLIRSGPLILAWSGRNIRARYQQSVLGWLWAIVQPVAAVIMFTVIFTVFVPVDTMGPPYVIFSYTALVPWTLFASAVTDMSGALVDNKDLIAKVYFPREVLPIAALLSRLVDFGVASGLLLLLLLYYRLPVFVLGWLCLPLVLLIQLMLVLGLGLASAALNVFYRDVKPLLALGLQLWFYASPIIYPVSMVPERLRSFYFFNPMAGTLEAYRAVLLYQKLPGTYLLISGGVAVVVLVCGYWFFKHVEYRFADVI